MAKKSESQLKTEAAYKNISELESNVTTLKYKTDSIEDNTTYLSVAMTIGMILLLIVAITTCAIIENRLEKPTVKEEKYDPVMASGVIERVTTSSIMIGNKIYTGVCRMDIEPLKVGDYVVIEHQDIFCDRATYQYTPTED